MDRYTDVLTIGKAIKIDLDEQEIEELRNYFNESAAWNARFYDEGEETDPNSSGLKAH